MKHKRANYYDILGVSRTADKDRIKAACRRLAQACHPDKNPAGDTGPVFIIITHAYHVLICDKTKKEYDACLDRVRNRSTVMASRKQATDPIVEQALSEFNDVLWDIDDMLKRTSDESMFMRINDADLHDCLLRFFGYLEREIVGTNPRFLNFSSKTNRIKLHRENYFYLFRLDIDQSIKALKPDIRKKTGELDHLMMIKREMIRRIGELCDFV